MAISDPIERAQFLSHAINELQEVVTEAFNMRRTAIFEARDAGQTQDEIARSLGVTPGRVSQISKIEYVTTGWFAPAESEAGPRLAICGSRSDGTETRVIDEVLRPLSALLTRRHYRVLHGPAGVGIEVMTYVADHHRPSGLGAITGVVGRRNIIRNVDYLLVIGGGQGTQDEVDMSFSAGKKLLPMPTSGGAAARAYAAMQRNPYLRSWVGDSLFSTLATADADEFVRLAEELLPH